MIGWCDNSIGERKDIFRRSVIRKVDDILVVCIVDHLNGGFVTGTGVDFKVGLKILIYRNSDVIGANTLIQHSKFNSTRCSIGISKKILCWCSRSFIGHDTGFTCRAISDQQIGERDGKWGTTFFLINLKSAEAADVRLSG